MKLFAALKQLVTLQPAIMQFVLENVYYRKDRSVHGTFYIQPNTALSISDVTITVLQKLHVTKEETDDTVLWTKVFRQTITLERLEKHEFPFAITIKFPPATKREKKNYKGDMGPLNKATDKSKTQLYTYVVQAEVKLKGKKEPLVYEERMRVE